MVKKLSKEQLQKMTRPELRDYCKNNNIRGYSNTNKAERIELILNFYKSKPVKISGVIPKVDETNEIEKDYQNLKKKNKLELWRNYNAIRGRSHPEERQTSKHNTILFILENKYQTKQLDQWKKSVKKVKLEPVKIKKRVKSISTLQLLVDRNEKQLESIEGQLELMEKQKKKGYFIRNEEIKEVKQRILRLKSEKKELLLLIKKKDETLKRIPPKPGKKK